MNLRDELLRILSSRIRTLLARTPMDFNKLQEIRMRINAPIMVIYNNREYFVSRDSSLRGEEEDGVIVTQNELKETMEYISNYSLYAFEKEIQQGFITIQGGHRVGISGKTIIEGERVKGIQYISFVNIRLAHQVLGCADSVIPYLYNRTEKSIYHTLIISPPRCGKTTLLRDLIRQVSDGTDYLRGLAVGVVDERSEIGACYMGVPQNDLGIRTDILDCCPKALGMMMLIRSMSPSVIAVDEIGARDDVDAIEYIINCGCKLIATVHGSSLEDIKLKPELGRLVEESIFERYIVLNNRGKVGMIQQILDKDGSILVSES